MEYRQSFDQGALLELGVDEALDDIRAELGANLLEINNAYCEKKFGNIGDVFWGFPASPKEYNDTIKDIIPLANDIISLGYAALDADMELKKSVLEGFFSLREDLKKEMASL